MKKTIKNNKRILIILGVIIILLAAWFIFNDYSQAQDKARFQQAERNKNLLVREVIRKFDVPSGNKISNRCYKSEYSPYNNGNLWCRLESSVSIPKTESDLHNSLDKHIREYIKSQGLANSNKRASEVEFEGAKNLPCVVNIINSTTDSNIQLSVACSDRAKAKHYPYSE